MSSQFQASRSNKELAGSGCHFGRVKAEGGETHILGG